MDYSTHCLVMMTFVYKVTECYKCCFSSVALLALWTSTAFAADFYVSPTGSDLASGSANEPYKTITKALSVVGPGQSILVREGTYPGFTVRYVRGETGREIVPYG